MTSYQRVFNTFEGKEVDKIPNMNIAMALVAKCAGVTYSEYAQNYKKLVEGNLYCVEHFGFDAVSVISDPMREAAAFGASVLFPENGVPHCKVELLEDECDLSRLKIVSPYDNIRTLDRIKAIELFKEKVGGKIPIVGWVEGVMAECADLRGISKLMFDLADEEDYLEELMCIVQKFQFDFIKAQVEAGADIIGVGNAVASIVGPKIYEEYAMKYDKEAIEYIHKLGAKAKLHICGNITPLLPMLKIIEPDILDIDWMVDYKSTVELFKDTRTCVCGNLDPVSVIRGGTIEDVEKKTKECVAAADNKSFIACGCEVPADSPIENLIAMNKMLTR